MGDRKRNVLEDLEADTRQVPQYDRLKAVGRVPTLTVLYHPRLNRIGERVRLGELAKAPGRVALSRLEPEFAPPTQTGAGLPLASPFLSRRPLWIAAEYDGSFSLDTSEAGSSLVVDGATVRDTRTCSRAAVERGVVIEVAEQVVLLFHLTDAPVSAGERFGLVGDSDGIAQVRAQIARVARTNAPVLVRGETGTGKELVARAVHDASERGQRPYLTVNMAAIPSSLAASELFGHVRGAFSGASQANAGYFGRADGGTLFMDEIGDTPPEVQASLLRVLETGEVQQLGADRLRRVDVRLVAATDADIDKEVEAGRFRAPLYYRLANQEVRLPPLCERRDDVGRLLLHFLEGELDAQGRGAALLDVDGQGMSWLPAAIAARLMRYAWPGNVRQLRNVARYLASLDPRAAPLHVDDPHLDRLLPAGGSVVETIEQSSEGIRDRLAALEAERDAARDDEEKEGASEPARPERRSPSDIGADELERVMASLDFKLGPTAAELGISRPALNELVDAHPTLERANNLSREVIAEAQAACEGDVDAMWRRLRVSKRGLVLRMREVDLS